MRPILCTICLFLAAFVASPVRAADGETFYVNPETGADTNPGTKEKPFKTLPSAADRVNELKGEGAVTIILSPVRMPSTGSSRSRRTANTLRPIG